MILSFHVGLTDSDMQRMQLFFSISVCSTVSRQLDAENWTRENWSPQPGRATIGRARQLDACDNWTRATIGRWTHATIFEVINFINSLLKVLCMLQLLGNILFFFRILLYLLGM
jgi:hypothetical protein